jgi:hypothetical protein
MNGSAGREFYDRQIGYLESGDIDGLMSQYHDDAILIGFDLTVRGAAALRTHMEGYLAHLGSLRLVSTDKFTGTEDSIFFEATVDTDLGRARVYDVFMLRDGRATHQFTGVLSVTPAPPR